MEIKVLGYAGKIQEGGDGFYVHFYNYTNYQDHWTVVGFIAQKYGILRNNTDPESLIDWTPLFSKLKHVNFGSAYSLRHRFPEFKDITGLLKFVSLLNNDLKEPDSNFINLNYII